MCSSEGVQRGSDSTLKSEDDQLDDVSESKRHRTCVCIVVVQLLLSLTVCLPLLDDHFACMSSHGVVVVH